MAPVMALTMHRRALGETNGERGRGRARGEERRGRRHSCIGGRKESARVGGGGGEIEKNIAARGGEGGSRREEGGWGHSWGGSIVINIYFLGSPPPNYSRCYRVLMHNGVSSLDTRLNRYIRAFELSACTRLVWKVVRFPNRSGEERWWKR